MGGTACGGGAAGVATLRDASWGSGAIGGGSTVASMVPSGVDVGAARDVRMLVSWVSAWW